MSGSSNWSRIVPFQGTDTGSFPVPGTVVVAQLEERLAMFCFAKLDSFAYAKRIL